jgi:hypothetical protein
MHEFVDFGVVNLDGKTAVTGPTARSTTTHSLCSGSRVITVFGVKLLIDGSLTATFSVTEFQCCCTILKRMGHAFAAST